MANVTDPLIRSVQGSDPQNLMEYITRQKIYESRFWKEECFGLTAADVMEKTAKSLTCVGGTFGGMGKPTKFLSLTLKLLQLQPDMDLVKTFLEQNHFKYLKVLGAFYLRLTGRPQDIYEMLDPLYASYSKLKYRDVNEWKLIHVDDFIDELLTKPFCCGIAMPRLPIRETLQEAGYLEEGPRPTALHDALTEAGGIKEYLKIKVDQEVRKQLGRLSSSPATTSASDDVDNCGSSCNNSAISLWEKRYGKLKGNNSKCQDNFDGSSGSNSETASKTVASGGDNKRKETDLDTGTIIDNKVLNNSSGERTAKRKVIDDVVNNSEVQKKKKKKDKKKSEKYGTLFKSSVDRSKNSSKGSKEDDGGYGEAQQQSNKPVDQDSDEYWNNLRSTLGMNPLKK